MKLSKVDGIDELAFPLIAFFKIKRLAAKSAQLQEKLENQLFRRTEQQLASGSAQVYFVPVPQEPSTDDVRVWEAEVEEDVEVANARKGYDDDDELRSNDDELWEDDDELCEENKLCDEYNLETMDARPQDFTGELSVETADGLGEAEGAEVTDDFAEVDAMEGKKNPELNLLEGVVELYCDEAVAKENHPNGLSVIIALGQFQIDLQDLLGKAEAKVAEAEEALLKPALLESDEEAAGFVQQV
ncbi:hypothetical protein P7C70_g616, partial [Phenoliferia sp. Uapishka_3]